MTNTDENSVEHLEAFLLRARAQTWAGGAEPTRTTPRGEKQYEYSEGALVYRDTFMTGDDSFFGQETLYESEQPIWNILYAGQVHKAGVKGPGVKAVYAFLQRAVRATVTDNRLGREANHAEGEWAYADLGEIHGNKFWGSEWVSFGGKEVYRLKYCGGWIIE